MNNKKEFEKWKIDSKQSLKNLEEEETLTLGNQTFLNEMILDESL